MSSTASSSKQFKPPGKRAAVPESESGSITSIPSPKIPKLKEKLTENDVKYLLTELEKAKAQIKEFEDEGHSVEELQECIDLLHAYNEYKDMAQLLMGQIAIMEGVPLKEIAQKFNAPADLD